VRPWSQHSAPANRRHIFVRGAFVYKQNSAIVKDSVFPVASQGKRGRDPPGMPVCPTRHSRNNCAQSGYRYPETGIGDNTVAVELTPTWPYELSPHAHDFEPEKASEW